MAQIPDERIKIYNNGGDQAFPGLEGILRSYKTRNASQLSPAEVIEIDRFKESFDIKEFKKNSEKFFLALNDILEYKVDEIFKFYTLQNKLSDTILVIIIHALYFAKSKSSVTSNYNSNDLDKYRITLWNKLKGTSIDKALSADVTLTANELVIHENLHDANLFELYNKVIEVENSNHETIFLNRIKELSNNINKYFFLTEILFKLLSDTKYNVGSNTPVNEIVRNFSEYTDPELGITGPNNATLSRYSRQNSCTSDKRNPRFIVSQMKDKLLKNIYDIVLRINTDKRRIEDSSQQLNNYDIDSIENDISRLKNDKNIDSKKLTTLLKKQKEINSSNRISFIKTLLLFILLIIIIGSNIYVSTTNQPNKLLQFNIFLIVIIFIMKFYYLFK